MLRTREEYGGFLPLELKSTGEYYSYDKNNMIRLNCAKAGISILLDTMKVNKIYIPYYLCPNVCKEIENHKKEVIYYRLDNNLLPESIPDDAGNCIYLVDYFGIMDSKISAFADQFQFSKIIMDNSHSFYHKPIMKENIYNIYSCKKFFGVPDGAYLIAKHLEVMKLKKTFSSENAQYLLKCLEHGTNYCYKEKKGVDNLISENYGSMSVLAEKILSSIDYEFVKCQRINNLRIYEEAFANINSIEIENESVPYMYPLNVGANIKKALVEQKIYVPTLWGHLLQNANKESLEFRLSDETIFLPLDQRYNETDIKYVIWEVQKALQSVKMLYKKEKRILKWSED